MKKPTLIEIAEYAKSIGFSLDAEEFYSYYGSQGYGFGESAIGIRYIPVNLIHELKHRYCKTVKFTGG